MSNIKIVRLKDGNDVVGEVELLANGCFKINRPVLIRISIDKEDPTGQPKIAFGNWLLPYINQDFIVTISDFDWFEPAEEIVDNYRKLFGMIITPKTELYVPSSVELKK